MLTSGAVFGDEIGEVGVKNSFCCRTGEDEIVLAQPALTICERMRSRIGRCVKMFSKSSGMANTREVAVRTDDTRDSAAIPNCGEAIVNIIREAQQLVGVELC